ncbi:LysR family transcriptional regulator [Pseudoteredinibacter isoporae]|uniref:DNA-binding transcriptional LysR family regulator n=1 Tax=Pseudoteredinibacter isoporae TaxID=570281 RepID=A0A7X0MYY2_9GAMM|nr:LysR family transcriptional regulator [Pseudoteredinibacter isoporae]MBB6522557.1 DNA-binding transcriptional LysR family regulator [Pseudoteredinibacter isoporae]NHO88087.1 LysR family transcriptional regulator [Pseudoteredinibacter isoporae]NIB23582.1 LysR family transcriptional regulator [Pseudoteredinibacter isoporae]
MDRHLQQFKKVVEVGSINAAAEALYISQPTLTQNIKKLEERIGSKLLNRTPQGITPTAYGEVLYDHVRAMDNTYQQAMEKIKILKHKKSFALQIGSGFVCWEVCVKDSLKRFQKRQPDASVHIEIGNNLYLYDRALSGHLDLFFGHQILGLDKKPGVKFIPLWKTTHCYFARNEHPLAGKPIAYEEMAAYPWLEVSHHDSRYLAYIKSVEENPLEQERRNHDIARVSTNSMSVGLELLLEEDLILPFVSEYTQLLSTKGVSKLDVQEPAIEEQVGVYVPEDNIKQEALDFIAYVQESTIPFDKFRQA